MATRLFIKLGLFAALAVSILFQPSSALAHFDPTPGSKIGEYRVTLDSIQILKFAPGFLGDVNPDLFVHTYVQAQTHEGQEAIFSKDGTWPGGWDDIPVPAGGTSVGIGKLIYHNVDCTPSEPLRVIINIGDRDTDLSAPVKDFIKARGGIGGIIAIQNPTANDATKTAFQLLFDALSAEFSKMGQFPQIDSGAGLANPFTIGDNSGVHTITSVDDGRQFSATFTATYKPGNIDCTEENLNHAAIQLAGSELLANGSFEEGFAKNGVAQHWFSFDNGGEALYYWQDETWSSVVLEGQHSQLMEIDTRTLPDSEFDRYAGICQVVEGVTTGSTLQLGLNGLLRTLPGDRFAQKFGYRIQWGIDPNGGTDWTVINNWVEVPWDNTHNRLEPGSFLSYHADFDALSPKITLCVRAWKKWPSGGNELDVNLDGLSLKGFQ